MNRATSLMITLSVSLLLALSVSARADSISGQYRLPPNTGLVPVGTCNGAHLRNRNELVAKARDACVKKLGASKLVKLVARDYDKASCLRENGRGVTVTGTLSYSCN